MKKIKAQSGFSMLELMIVLALMSIIMGSIFGEIHQAQQRSSAEQVKADLMQESREFVDQMTRDLRDAGYPNRRNFAPEQLFSPDVQDNRAANGVVKVDTGEIIFEGAVGGTDEVSAIVYRLDDDCPHPACLKRSEELKTPGDPLIPRYKPFVQVQNVINDLATEPIFSAFRTDGTPVTLPVDVNNGDAMASIGTIKIYLRVQAQVPDQRTGERPIFTFVSTVKLPNCTMAYSSQGQSCN